MLPLTINLHARSRLDLCGWPELYIRPALRVSSRPCAEDTHAPSLKYARDGAPALRAMSNCIARQDRHFESDGAGTANAAAEKPVLKDNHISRPIATGPRRAKEGILSSRFA